MEIQIQVGTVAVRVEADQLEKSLLDFFSAFPGAVEAPRLTVRFGETIGREEKERPYFHVAQAALSERALRFSDYAAPIGYVIEADGDGLSVRVHQSDFSRLGFRQRLKGNRWLNPFYSSRDDQALGSFLYGLWQYLIQVLLAQNGATFVHASGVEKGGRCLLLPAWGGVGKTSTMYQLVLSGGWRFIADDLAILKSTGEVLYNPTPMAVYPYNLVGLPDVRERVIAGFDLPGRLQWEIGQRLRGLDGVGRRISAASLFGPERIVPSALLDRAIYLLRWDAAEFEMRSLASEELAVRTTSVLMAELRQFRYEYQAWTSVPGFSLLPPIWQVAECTQTAMLNAFRGRELYLLCIPRRATPAQVFDFITARL